MSREDEGVIWSYIIMYRPVISVSLCVVAKHLHLSAVYFTSVEGQRMLHLFVHSLLHLQQPDDHGEPQRNHLSLRIPS
jgi:hypothetical protein